MSIEQNNTSWFFMRVYDMSSYWFLAPIIVPDVASVLWRRP